MALPTSPPAVDQGTPADPLSIDGALVAAIELERFPSNYQPADHVWLFRSASSWSVLTMTRRERWRDDGSEDLAACSARALVQSYASIDELGSAIGHRYGGTGWRDLLDAGAQRDPDLFFAWAPGALERDLMRVTFYRPELVGPGGVLDRIGPSDLVGEAVERLEAAGLHVSALAAPNRVDRLSEGNVVAFGTVRRYGWEADIVVRIDPAGEVYTRLDQEDDEDEPALRTLDDDDA